MKHGIRIALYRDMYQCKICKRIRPIQFPCNDSICDGHDYGPDWDNDMRLVMRWVLGALILTIVLGYSFNHFLIGVS